MQRKRLSYPFRRLAANPGDAACRADGTPRSARLVAAGLFYAWKKQLQEQVARAFDPGVGRDAETDREREIEKLHAKIGQLTVERDLLRALVSSRMQLSSARQ